MVEHEPEFHDIPDPDLARILGKIEPEDIPAEEYKRSYDGLWKFPDVDIMHIRNLEDLSATASLVGHDLRTAVLAVGNIEENTSPFLLPGKAKLTNITMMTQVLGRTRGENDIVEGG